MKTQRAGGEEETDNSWSEANTLGHVQRRHLWWYYILTGFSSPQEEFMLGAEHTAY